ncbi:hypothetical protein EEX84_14770 [Planococcus salinus]|uniref:Uncharacterized protein n=2 Tax=Planococcus salinus TaxID=1848460 RepID=A0A3M8P402_9BACL|nr:hypothetical protein EEX84_14770 [Planococcus salinus]
MTLILFAGMMYMTHEEEVHSVDGLSLTIDKPTLFTLSDPEVSEEGSDIRHERAIKLLGLQLGTYTIVERTLDNDVKLLFEEVDNTGWMPYALSLNMSGLEGGELTSWNPEPVDPSEDPVYGQDPTSNPFGAIEWNGNELLQGQIYVSREITLGDGTEVMELRHENPNLEFEEGTVLKSFWLPPKHISQTWTMLAPAPLFASEEAEQQWIDFSLNNRQEQLNWLTPEGPLVKLPLTDDPRTQMAYGFIAERTQDPTSAEWNETSPSLFFESMILNAEVNQDN